jgi:uncharacterized protein
MTRTATFVSTDDALVRFLDERLRDVFAARDRVAIKLHMGEPGNTYYIAAPLAKRVVDCVARAGARPFIFDSPVTYRSPRDNPKGYLGAAAKHGYTEGALGCPIVISDESVAAKGSLMTYRLCSEPLEADGVLLLTHVKGHDACGMGGAVKNVGMGCMAKATKAAIHTGGEPVYAGEGCTQCGECAAHCPTGNITVETGGPCFGATWCPGCSNCALVCPADCIAPRLAPFDELLAEAAALAHERFKKRFAVNVLRNLATHCDCMPDSGPLLAADVGFVCADDMVAADAASLEVLARKTGHADLFGERFKHSPWEHVRAAGRFTGRGTDVAVREI